MHPQQPQHQPGQQPSTPYQEWAPPPSPPPYLQGPPRRRKKSPAKMIVLIMVGAFVVLVAIGMALGGGEDAPVAASSPTAPAASRTAPFVSGIPKPNGQQTEDLLAGLRQIDAELDRSRSIDRARNTCSDMLAGEKRSDIVEKTKQRFDGTASIDTADARTIVKLIEEGGWCR